MSYLVYSENYLHFSLLRFTYALGEKSNLGDYYFRELRSSAQVPSSHQCEASLLVIIWLKKNENESTPSAQILVPIKGSRAPWIHD